MDMCTQSLNRGKQVCLGANEGAYEAPSHKTITQQYLHYVFPFRLYSTFRADIVESSTNFN
jgi:hypothetical protein